MLRKIPDITLRILLFFTVGGTVSLGLLSLVEPDIFGPWASGFLIAIPLVFIVAFLIWRARNTKELQSKIDDSVVRRQVRAARILSRRQTGRHIKNDQPEVEFKLLVDGPWRRPFLATTRKVIMMIDVHKYDEGQLIAVAQPNPDYGDVFLSDAPIPTPTNELTYEEARGAQELPLTDSGRVKAQPSAVIAFSGALIAGFLVAPFLAAPDAVEYIFTK